MTASQPKFEIERLDAEELAGYPRLSELYHLMNRGFGENMKKHPDILRPKEERFNSEQQLLDELGSGSEVVLFLMTEKVASEDNSTSHGRIVATASYKPYKIKWLLQGRYDAERKRVFGTSDTAKPREAGDPTVYLPSENKSALFAASKTQGSPESQTGALAMEIVAVVVEPERQGHGLASQLVEAIADEVDNRARASNDGNVKFQLWARTAKEVNEHFWKRQGFRTVEARFFEAGLFGSVKGFHLVTMVKEVDVTKRVLGGQ